jgi:vacuolar-type H+-ATPase subunit H
MKSKKLPSEPAPTTTTTTAERLAAIVDAAERAATSVIDDAERQAEQTLEAARSRADKVVAERLRELADELDPPAEAPAEPRLRSVDSNHEPEADAPRRSGSAGARLFATQMAVSGSSREEIEARLRSGFEIEDASEILDAILGPEE